MAKHERIYIIDVIRGMAVFWAMIMANPGTSRRPSALIHAEWHGNPFIDYILPLFVIAMCMVIPLIYEKNHEKTLGKHLIRVFRRSVLLFFLGMLLNFTPDFDLGSLRILGVLQRLALVYLAVNIWLLIMRKMLDRKQMKLALLITGITLTIFYMLLIHPWGYEMETNLIRRIDLQVITESHMYKRQPFDPEGLLSTVGAIATGLFAAVVGYLLIDKEMSQKDKLITMLLLGGGLVLASFISGIWVPINKKMWTGTFVFSTAGWTILYTALFYYICDIKRIRRPFMFLTYLGHNALFIYVAGEYISKLLWPIQIYFPPLGESYSIPAYVTYRFLTPLVGTPVEGVGFGLLYTIFWILIARIMYKKNIMIRL